MQNIDDAYSRFQKTSTFIKVHVCITKYKTYVHVSHQTCSTVSAGLTILRNYFQDLQFVRINSLEARPWTCLYYYTMMCLDLNLWFTWLTISQAFINNFSWSSLTCCKWTVLGGQLVSQRECQTTSIPLSRSCQTRHKRMDKRRMFKSSFRSGSERAFAKQ